MKCSLVCEYLCGSSYNKNIHFLLVLFVFSVKIYNKNTFPPFCIQAAQPVKGKH